MIVTAISAQGAANTINKTLKAHGYRHEAKAAFVVEWPLKGEKVRLLGDDGDY